MRRVTTVALVAGGTMAVVAGGAFAFARLMGRGSAIPKPVTGMFPNGMAYARWGAGAEDPAGYSGRSGQQGTKGGNGPGKVAAAIISARPRPEPGIGLVWGRGGPRLRSPLLLRGRRQEVRGGEVRAGG